LAPRFRTLTRDARRVLIAAPFWGHGAIQSLGINQLQNVLAICNLRTNACNPHVIAELMCLKGVSVRTHPRLHMKVYASEHFAIVGSSNASANGLAIEGAALGGWIEANVLSDNEHLVQEALCLFDDLWNNQTEDITDDVLEDAKIAWANRPSPDAALKAPTLLEACRENPNIFDSVFVLAYADDLTKRAEIVLSEEKRSGSENILAYQVREKSVREKLTLGSWLIGLNCRVENRPFVSECSQFNGQRLKVSGEDDLILVEPAKRWRIQLNGSSRHWRLSPDERNSLERYAHQIIGASSGDPPDGLLSLRDAMRIIDRGGSSGVGSPIVA